MTETTKQWTNPPAPHAPPWVSHEDEADEPVSPGPGSSPPRSPSTAFTPAPPGPPTAGEPQRQAGIAPPEPPTWAGELLSGEGDLRALARRSLLGVLLACAYGVALGAREGGASLFVHALGVPAALVAVALVGLPSLCIVLALFGAPLSLDRAALAAARGLASAGLVLAGLAPLAAFYVVTSASPIAAALAASLGLVVGGALGLRHLVLTLREALEEASPMTRAWATVCQLGFGVFAVLLGWRVWGAMLPLVGGA